MKGFIKMRNKKNPCDICKDNCTKHPYHFRSDDGSISTICARNKGQAIRINRADDSYHSLYYPAKTCRRSNTL